MSDYPEIIRAAFPPAKARQILEREQQRRGIVAVPAKSVPAAKPDSVPPVIIHHHDKVPLSPAGMAGRAVAVTLISLLGI